jgi:hypothetical protein
MKTLSRPALTVLLLYAALLFSCATAPEPPPAWAFDAEAAWPTDKYIAQKGHGEDRQKAELSALEALSRYFVTEVHSATRAAASYTETGGDVSRGISVDEQVFVQSQTKLFAVRYAEAWHNPAAGEWEALAYIERAEAWALYEPGLRQKAGQFESAWGAAETETESLKQLYLYSRCRVMAEGLPALLEFAQILYPQGAARYSGLGQALAGLPQKIETARSEARIYIDCPGEFEGMLSGALGRAFGEAGRTLEKDKTLASVVCAVDVEENAQKQRDAVFYRPALTLRLQGKTETLLSWNTTAGRAGGFKPDVAKRRAWAGLVQKIEESFPLEFEKRMNSF